MTQEVKSLPTVKWNVISNEEYKRRVKRVLDNASEVLSNTLGPYGSTSMLQMSAGQHRFSKDGYSVLKRFIYSDIMEDSIGDMILNISQRIVRKVGDGSTSAVLAAKELYDSLNELSTKTTKYRPRVVQQKIVNLSKLIIDEIRDISTPIDRDGDFGDIYNLARISTNDNEEVAGLIQKAYQTVRSTDIRFMLSRDSDHSLEIIEGYQLPLWYNDSEYVNSAENKTATMHDIDVVMFDHFVEYEYHYHYIKEIIKSAHESGRRVLIVAPQYDQVMWSEMKNNSDYEKRTAGNLYTIWATVDNASILHRAKYADLSALLGAKLIGEHVINEYNKKTMSQEEREKMFNARLQGTVNESIDTDFNTYMGKVGRVVLGERQSLFTEFNNINTSEYEKIKVVAEANYRKQLDYDNEHDTPGTEILPLHERLMSLNLAVAIIKVGGGTIAERKANLDLVDDAVKACRAAYDSGYNFGGNLAIVYAGVKILDDEAVELDELDRSILICIINAFESVYKYVLRNAAITDRKEIKDIIDRSIEEQKCYNLVTEEFDGTVINPTMTDVEILEATSSIVSLLITSNQYVATQFASDLV